MGGAGQAGWSRAGTRGILGPTLFPRLTGSSTASLRSCFVGRTSLTRGCQPRPSSVTRASSR
ncbi:hypothetical protein, partial [Frankia tisae]|uniref:hypothetical protein n=1 Tax=Frankia tisae TaxID=2950104 RepID=UPI0021BEBE2A